MFTKGEFTRIVRVTRRTLRHYRDIGLFVPVESDADNGYHYYTGSQESVWKSESLSDAGGVEVKAAEMKVDGVAESLAVAESPR